MQQCARRYVRRRYGPVAGSGHHISTCLHSRIEDETLSFLGYVHAEVPDAAPWELSLPLSLTAAVYARTGRLVFAEGLLREAAKRMQLSVDVAEGHTGPWRTDMHPSVPACVAWQFAQVCAATEKRGTEAEQWAQLAEGLWPHERQLRDHLGPRTVLKSASSRPHVPCLSYLMGRVFHSATASGLHGAGDPEA
jgi:hypothetical protein